MPAASYGHDKLAAIETRSRVVAVQPLHEVGNRRGVDGVGVVGA